MVFIAIGKSDAVIRLQMQLLNVLPLLFTYAVYFSRFRIWAPFAVQSFLVTRVVGLNLALRGLLPFGEFTEDMVTFSFQSYIVIGFLAVSVLFPVNYVFQVFVNVPIACIGLIL